MLKVASTVPRRPRSGLLLKNVPSECLGRIGKNALRPQMLEQHEGARFWLGVMNELKTRGVGDILIAVVDGLKGFPAAITAVFPQTTVQTCIVHLTRFSLAYCSWRDRKKVAGQLKNIY